MCLLAWRSNAPARTDSSVLCESFRVFISRVSEVFSGPPGPSVDILGSGVGSSTGRCSGGGKRVVVALLAQVAGSGATAGIPRADVCSEGRRFLAPSSRFFRLTMVFTNCLSFSSVRAGTSFIIAITSSRGWRGLDRRRCVGRNGSFASLTWSAPSCFGRAPCASENVLFGGTRIGGRSVGAWVALFDWTSTIIFA